MRRKTVINLTPRLRQLRQTILPTLKRHEVAKAGIFGSFARGPVRSSSDLDLLVEFQGRKSLLDLVGLKLDLEDLLGRPVDVVTYRSVHKRLRKIILNQHIRIL